MGYNLNMEERVREIIESRVDGIFFLPMGEDKEITFNGFMYEKKSKYEKSDLGHRYHILLYKVADNGYLDNLDLFEATLIDPTVYINYVISCGFFGIVCKKTKQSYKIANEFLKKYKKYENTQ